MATVTRIISEIEFVFDFEWTKVKLSNDYLQDVTLIGLYRDEEPCGVAISKQQHKLLEIIEIYCKGENESDWIFSCSILIDRLAEMSTTLEIPILFSVAVEHEYFGAVDELLQDKGFIRDADKRVVHCVTDMETEERWHDFMERKGNRLLERIARRGFVTTSYKEMSEQEKRVARLAADTGFDVSVDMERLRMPIDGENSFFTFLDKRLVAYCLVFRLSPRQLLFEYTIASRDFMHKGVSLVPIISFISNSFTYEQVQDVIFTYRVGNREMEALSSRMLSIVTRITKTRAYYMLRRNGGSNDVL